MWSIDNTDVAFAVRDHYNLCMNVHPCLSDDKLSPEANSAWISLASYKAGRICYLSIQYVTAVLNDVSIDDSDWLIRTHWYQCWHSVKNKQTIQIVT